jgi:DnaJ-class molecular chaperone
VFFGGAAGGIGRVLRMIPGPIGRIGMGIKIAQIVGTSIYALHKMKKAKDAANPNKQQEPESPLISNLKGMFSKPQSDETAPLNMDFSISIPPTEALSGTRKKISYQVNGSTEQLMVRIPPKFPSGGKLRIRNKGRIQNEERGDLILSINVDPKASTSS